MKHLPIWAAVALLAACGHSSPDGTSGSTPANVSTPNDFVDGWPAFDAAPSGRANQGTIIDGEFVGTDEIHFARGANADGRDHEQYYAPGGVPPEPQPSPVEDDDAYRHSTWGAFGADRAPHNGDYLLPTDTTTWPDFTADIAFLRLVATATDLYVHIRFLSFPRPEAQIATLTFTHTSLTPTVADWPRNAGIGSSYSQALTLWSDGGELASSTGSTADLLTIGGAVRVTDHAFEARIPLASLPAGQWKIGVGAGLANPDDPTQYWTVPAGAPTATSPGTDDANAPGSNVWDLMFTPRDTVYFDDHVQARLLAIGDVSDAVVVINPQQLQANSTVVAPAISGRIAHIYQSAFDFGDGITRGSPATSPPAIPVSTPEGVRPRDAAVNYEYTGGIQPYFAYVPEAYPASSHDWPLVLYFHGLNNYIWEPFGLTLGLEDELEARGYLFASTLGRGDISYTDRGELDPLEVIEHMSARYRIDPNRIYIMGHSHGGGGVTVISRRNPDKFAAVVPAQIMTALPQPENLLQIPTLQIAGAGDPIDNGQAAQARYDALSALGYDTQLLIYGNKTHENSSIYDAITQIFDIFDRTERDPNPPTVVFTRGGGDFNTELGLLHDGAYWVSDMVAVDDGQDMKIRATSFAIAHRPLTPDDAVRTNNQVFDSNGASGRSAGFLSTTVPAYGDMTTAEPRATLETTNLQSVTLDTARMSLDVRATNARFELVLGGDLQLTLMNVNGGNTLNWRTDDTSGTEITSGTAIRSSGNFTIDVPAATTTVRFQ